MGNFEHASRIIRRTTRSRRGLSQPLAVGIDHVSMHITYSPRGNAAVDVVLGLAERHGLVIYDPQFDEVFGLHPKSHRTY
ncbi:hypothetical protein ABZ783_05385 [Micromonospora sp. NPDC047738]|uniref:hypothetical protein n=1 Tax=Micromonospora sp. NPDC047738 TaxID=3155741 RepID=UPI003410B884